MTQNEIIYSVRNQLRQEVDDSSIDDREILFELNIQRAVYYTNEFNKPGRYFDEDIIQTLCMKMEVADRSDCGCQFTGCNVLRTVDKVPPTLGLHTGNAIIRVTGIDSMSVPFSLVPFSRIPYVGDGKFDKNMIYASLHPNGHIYLKSDNNLAKMIEYIYVTVVLEDPMDAKPFKDCNTGDCYSGNSEYPLKAKVLGYISEMVVQKFLRKLQIPEDQANNADDK